MTDALINPEVLAWCRKRAQLTIAEIAERLHVPATELEAWESGLARPTVRQAQTLARIYNQPLAMFYLPKPPTPHFSYGHPDGPSPDDPRFVSEEEAITTATAQQEKQPGEGGVLAIWDDDTGEILALVHEGFVYFSH